MEGIEQNPVLYELMMTHTWRNEVIDLEQWLPQYILNRYGVLDAHAADAWKVLQATVYNGKLIRDGAESILQARPTFDSLTRWTKTTLNYDAADLLPAWDALVQAAETCKGSDGFQYDLVDVTRQVLANYALPLQRQWVAAYRQKDLILFKQLSKQFITLMDDLDRLLATRKDFMLGPWIADARRWGTHEADKALYEKNARDLITLWGDAKNPLHEYACRQWSGLITDFYKPRWQQFFAKAEEALAGGKDLNMAAFQQTIAAWEWKWVNKRKDYALQPVGNSITVVKQLHRKYRAGIEAAY